MALTATLLGTNYSIPEPGDAGYDQALTNYLKALSTAFPQISGGTYSLTAELDFGVSFGIKAAYLKSETSGPAAAGAVRFARSDTLSWRNSGNSADLPLGVNANSELTFNTKNVTGNAYLSASTIAGQSIPTGATEAIVVFGTVDVDSDAGYNSGTGRYTIPTGKDGDYLIYGQI